MLDDDVMLDLSNHAFQSSLLFGCDLTKLRLLLVTHRHRDHLYTHHLIWRTKMRTADNRIIEPTNDFDMYEAIHWTCYLSTNPCLACRLRSAITSCARVRG